MLGVWLRCPDSEKRYLESERYARLEELSVGNRRTAQAGSAADGAAQAEGIASLEAYLAKRVPGVGEKRVPPALLDTIWLTPAILLLSGHPVSFCFALHRNSLTCQPLHSHSPSLHELLQTACLCASVVCVRAWPGHVERARAGAPACEAYGTAAPLHFACCRSRWRVACL